MNLKVLFLLACIAVFPALLSLMHGVKATEEQAVPTTETTLKAESIPSKTDDEVIQREEDTITAEGFSVHDQKLLREKAEKHEFQASVSSLMKIIVNSLYSNREVFLREVISNASDALDKIRFLSVQDPKLLDANPNLEIKIRADRNKRSLHIIDSGIGMTKEDLIKNLGTIAQSGTAAFLENYKKNGDLNMIGQFGVGFYSVFLVADTVSVATKHNDSEHQYVWQSDSKGSFTISEDPRGNTLGRGTQLTLHLKEDAEEFLDETVLRNLVVKYSEFITFPIKLWTSHEEEKEVLLTPEEVAAEKEKEAKEKKEGEEEKEEEVSLDEEKKEEKTEEEEEKPRTKKVKETLWDWELMNQTKPLWARPPKDITQEEYHSFYKAFTKDYTDPAHFTHFNAEGEVEFKSLLFIPANAPSNMFDPNSAEGSKSIKLFVKRVFITDEFKDILPKYLSFIKGLVDSDDLPLNVSREMLQEHKILKVIKKKLVRKALAMVQELAEGKKEKDTETEEGEKKDTPKETNEKYQAFWKNFGTNIKLGVIEDTANRTRLSKLLLFFSSKTKNLTSLADYVSRMKEGQTQIYYLAGENKEAVETSPLIERLVKKGYEVLYMVDAIDEYALSHMEKFDGKYKLTNIAKDGLTLDGENDEEREKEDKEKFSKLIDFLKDTLGPKVEKVVISKRLTTSPSALVSGTHGWTANMERIVKAQALGQKGDQYQMYAPKKTLEINPRHPLLKELLKRVESTDEQQTAKDIALLMYETALLSSGFSLDDTSDFASRITRMMHLSLNIDPAAQADEEQEAAPKEVFSAEENEGVEEPEVTFEPSNTKDEL